MSARHPIISVTGSSGAGTTSVRNTFEQIFRREDVSAVYIEGDAFHALDRNAMRKAMAEEPTLSHFAPRANLLPELEEVFRTYGESGIGRTRHYVHDAADAQAYGAEPGTFTPWEDFQPGSDLLFYEGLHGCVVDDNVDMARYADLKIGVVPVINLEWIQKLHRDRSFRGYSTEAVTDVILRRMPDYVQTICPQFTWTDINFQRVPTVDTSNPFIARWIPTADESMVVIRFKDPKGIDFSYLISMIQGSFMSRANSIVIPGGKLDIAMQLILTPIIMQLVERKRRLA
ncbi:MULTISPECIES: phosphoribulokinase [unclassified Methylobacterium]|jgi:phosphoribulokinase|uniref:phosphoribulokinase n=1 Tax=unclassified Methylobacterium TaxID=2615210 RepID=UPI0006FE9520|nr:MULTISPECIES: phosphoribulokinase [unclassified Methylobacterium]KQO50074.1 phosphoribulokinase [Methylobacterium sp. Leaf86]KQO84865.1 phosphoribulokinase [Methylobacterium sp. Leaf91]MBO1020973.1 phosphoribulokinase [Methylobacterium sp. SD274]